MPSIAEDADYFRLALVAELLSTHEIVSWADSTISRQGEPSSGLIEVSLCPVADPQEMSRRLGDLAAAEPFREGATRRVFHLLHSRLVSGVLSHLRVASALYILSQEASGLSEPEAAFLSWLDDEIELIEAGYKDMSGAIEELEHFLGGYAASPRCASDEV